MTFWSGQCTFQLAPHEATPYMQASGRKLWQVRVAHISMLRLTKEELRQSILLLEAASWIQIFDYKNLKLQGLFASKHTIADHQT